MMLRFILCWTLGRQSYVEANAWEKGEKKNFDVPLCCSGSSSIFIFASQTRIFNPSFITMFARIWSTLIKNELLAF